MKMSKAVICDRCKKAFAEQSAHHIEMKRAFITSEYDLCGSCAKLFHEEFMKPAESPGKEAGQDGNDQ